MFLSVKKSYNSYGATLQQPVYNSTPLSLRSNVKVVVCLRVKEDILEKKYAPSSIHELQ